MFEKENKQKKIDVEINRKELKSQELKFIEQEDIDGDGDIHSIRVQCEIIDFDWIFEGDNMKNLIKMLNEQENPALYVVKSMNALIDLIWDRYETAIIKRIFYPYLIYMFSFITLGSAVDGGYIGKVENGHYDGHKDEKVGDMVFFPSSLHHRTVPFTTDADRIIVSFDLMPEVAKC